MGTYELARAEWRRYCDWLSKQLAGQRVELDVASLDLGDHVEARWLPLHGIVFDARGDVLEISLEGVGHSILAPREIHLEETQRGLRSRSSRKTRPSRRCASGSRYGFGRLLRRRQSVASAVPVPATRARPNTNVAERSIAAPPRARPS